VDLEWGGKGGSDPIPLLTVDEGMESCRLCNVDMPGKPGGEGTLRW
jgi:hypothetical protein